jgi:hypothetical protein
LKTPLFERYRCLQIDLDRFVHFHRPLSPTLGPVVDADIKLSSTEQVMRKRGGKLSGEQGTAVAGLVMIPCTVLLHSMLAEEDSLAETRVCNNYFTQFDLGAVDD